MPQHTASEQRLNRIKKARADIREKKKRKGMSRLVALSLTTDNIAVMGEATEKNGQPVQKFKKEICRDGTYKHPNDGWTANINKDRRANWVAVFDEMKKNGVAVPVPISDDEDHHKVTPKNNGGYVIGMENDGKSLFAILEMVGKDAIDAAGRNDVSVFVEQGFTDGKGVNYGEAVTHVCLTPTPIVPGLDGFIPIAASRSGGKKPLTQAAAFSYDDGNEPPPLVEQGKMDIAALRKLLGAGEELTEENALEVLGERLEGDSTKINDLTKSHTDLKAEFEVFKTENPKSEDAPKLDPDVEDDLAEGAQGKLDKLVADGKVTPAASEKLAAALIGPEGKRNGFALSRKISGMSRSIINVVCDALGANDPVELNKIHTKIQTVAMTRTTPGGEPDSGKPTEGQQELMDEQIAMANQAAGVKPDKK